MRRDADLDFLLTMALDIHDNDLLCSCGCGFYRVDAHDDDADGWFKPDDSTICYARAAIEQYQREEANDAEAGTLITIVDERVTEARRRKLPADEYTRPAKQPIADESLG